jgi:DNA-3-methyladenine glycosylase II
MPLAADRWMTEYPAWLPTDKGVRRVFALHGGPVLAEVDADGLRLTALGDDEAEPLADVFGMPDGAAGEVPQLAKELAGLGRVGRFRNPSLWEALATAILRQVIRAGQSKKLYRELCATHGEQVALPDGDTYGLFPTPEKILALDDEQYAELGLAFKRPALRAAATAYLTHGGNWNRLSLPALVDELQSVQRIGPWTAGAAVADYTNTWDLYPYADLAVRTWAERAAPAHHWFHNERAFGAQWRHLAGEHLSTLTLLTLAWGSQHGDIG